MTKKIIKLTVGDLMNIVKRVIKEQDENYKINMAIQCFLNKKGIKDDAGQPLNPAVEVYRSQLGYHLTTPCCVT